MSDQTKWTDERIILKVESLATFCSDVDDEWLFKSVSVLSTSNCGELLRQVRDDLQAEIDKLTVERDVLRQMLVIGQYERLLDRFNELAKLAITSGEWQPLENAVEDDCIRNVDGYGFVEALGNSLLVHQMYSTARVALPPNVRLCQRVEAEWLGQVEQAAEGAPF